MQPYDEHNGIVLYQGDCRDVLADLPEQSVQTIVTSPPYFHLRRYTDDEREIGQEPTIAEYVSALVEVFMLCWRVLRDDGTLWLNIGDAYAGNGDGRPRPIGQTGQRKGRQNDGLQGGNRRVPGLRAKNLMGVPWWLAFALQDAGWILRSDIIWSKPAPVPESVQDRPTRSHEYVFLFAKSERYFFDVKAISEPMSESSLRRIRQTSFDQQAGGPKDYRNGTNPNRSARQTIENLAKNTDGLRQPRSVWTIASQPLADAHYAQMPQALAERCIKAGSRPGDVVLDPFAGSGTTGRASLALGRGAILIDLAYTEMQQRRTDKVQIRMEL